MSCRSSLFALCLTAILLGLFARNAAAQTVRVGPFLQQASPQSIWIVWETDSGNESRVDYGLTKALGSTAFGESLQSMGAARIHQTQITGLDPDTYYYYRAVTGGAASAILHFRTPPEAIAEQAFRFVALSDTQADGANPNKHREIINDGIISFVTDQFGPDMSNEIGFIMNAGDLVSTGTNYSQWKNDFFDEAQNLFQYVPLYPVLGNHEQNADWYFKYMRLPLNGSPGFDEHWYYVDYGNVRVIGLDSNGGYRIAEQLDWLDDVLNDACANADIDFVFAQLHHPYKSEVWTPGEIDYSGQVVRRLEQFSSQCGKPSVHFFGHTHAYSRGQSRDHRHLWVNVATGEGNVDYWGEYPIADYPEFQRSFVGWGFVMVEVEAGPDPAFRLRRVSRGNEELPLDNVIHDDFVIRLNNLPPDRPFPVFPTASDPPIDPDDPPLLLGSAFVDPRGDLALEGHFQVSLTPGDYTNPVHDDWRRFENWFAPPGASGRANGYFSVDTVTDPDITHAPLPRLAPHTSYYWRVRYRDRGLVWSDWSQEASFTTGPSALTENLLLNPGAEDGTADWVVLDPPLESLESGDCGASLPPVSGSRFFAVGGICIMEGVYGEAFQTVDISAYALEIDLGYKFAGFGGHMRNWSGSDLPELWIVFRDASGVETGRGPVLENRVPSWSLMEAVVDIPPTTRQIEFHISGTRFAGTDNDAYFDDLFVRLGGRAAGDLNCDGDIDAFDIEPFLIALFDPQGYAAAYPDCDISFADINGDGDVDAFDIEPFLELLFP